MLVMDVIVFPERKVSKAAQLLFAVQRGRDVWGRVRQGRGLTQQAGVAGQKHGEGIPDSRPGAHLRVKDHKSMIKTN